MSVPKASALRIGALAPLSPPGWTEAGRHLIAGMTLAAEAVNADGSVGGRPVELVVHDTAADPARAVAAMDALAAAGVVAVAGEYHSVVARAAAARADALGLPFLCASAVLDALVERETGFVARLAPPQSRGWRLYADFLLAAGHRRVAVAAQESVYWAAGTRILTDRLEAGGASLVLLPTLDPAQVPDALAASGATALLLLAGHPEPALPIVASVRNDPRLAGLLIGAPAGQPEFAEWMARSGAAGIPFLSYMPEQAGPLTREVETALAARLGASPSFVAFEGYDAVLVLAALLGTYGAEPAAIAAAWPQVAVEGTRGKISFSRVPGIGVWQWAEAPVRIIERDPADPARLRVLHSAD